MDKIIVVGGGVAGCRAALEAAKAGFAVQLWERDKIGGVCLNCGCVPTKALLAMAGTAEWSVVRESISTKIELLRGGMEKQLKRAKVDIIHDNFDISEAEEDAKIIWAVGRQWPKPQNATGKTVIDHRDILNLEDIPEELAIIGGGITGLEFAQIFAALGSRVTVYEMRNMVLPGFPNWAAERYMCACMEQNIEFELGQAVDISILPQECVFMATGAKADAVPEGVIAIGDCTGVTAMAYEAEADAINTVNIMQGKPQHRAKTDISVCCGRYDLVAVGEPDGVWAEANCRNSAAAFMSDSLDGFARLYSDDSGTLRGVVMMLPRAQEYAGLLAGLVEAEAKVDNLARAMFFHPAGSECIKEAAVKLSEML